MSIPDDVVKKWWDSAQFGTEFKAIVESFREKYPKLEDIKKDTARTPVKRTGSTAGLATPPLKKTKDSQETDLKDVEPFKGKTADGTLLYEISLVNLKDCQIVFKTGGIHIINGGSKQAGAPFEPPKKGSRTLTHFKLLIMSVVLCLTNRSP